MFEVHSATDLYSHFLEFHGFFDTIEEARDKGKSLLEERQNLLVGGTTGRYRYREVTILDEDHPINRMINSCQMGRIANETMKRAENGQILIESENVA